MAKNKKKQTSAKQCTANEAKKEESNSEKFSKVFVTSEGETRYLCSFCNQLFKYEAGLRRHQQRHEPPGGFACSDCNETFVTEAQRSSHKETVHKIFKCLICSMKFDSETEFNGHIEKLHGGQDRKYLTCDKCGAQFRQKNQLKLHCKSNCGKNRCFTCSICNSKFMTQFTLNTHMLIHNGEKKFLCKYCGSSFLSKGQLKIHERSHTKEKPYECKVCGKAFPYRESLVTHSSIHTGIKSFQCECCARQFSCIGNLIKHRRTRPETCGLSKYTNIKCAPRASTKAMSSSTEAQGKPKKPRSNINEEPTSPVYDTATTSISSEPMMILAKSDEPGTIDKNEPAASTKYKNIQLKVEPAYETVESNIVYVTTSDSYVVGELEDLPTRGDEIIISSPSERIIVLETDNIHFHDVQFYSTTTKNTVDAYPILLDEGVVDVKEHEPFHQTDDDKMQQYQIMSADELIEPSCEAEQTIVVETFECVCCALQFISNDMLMDHLKTAHAVEDASCEDGAGVPVTDEKLPNMKTNKNEKVPKNSRQRKKFTHICPKCGKGYSSRATLKDHQQSKCGQSPLYKCSHDGCSKAMHSLGSLKTHELIHTGTLSHGCRFCEKRFRTQGQVKVHERSHSGDKPFKCAQCPKAFAHRESLITHTSLHTGLKRFACQGCDRRFSCISNLQAHRRTHRSSCGQLPLDTKAQHIYVLDKASASVSMK